MGEQHACERQFMDELPVPQRSMDSEASAV